HDGEQGLAKMMTNNYAVILADLLMPNIDGYAVVDNAALLAPTTPVIVMSGLTDLQNAIRVMKMGAFDYLVKPLDFERVETSIGRALQHHALAQNAYDNEHQLLMYAAELESENYKLGDQLSMALAELELNNRATFKALTVALEACNFETRDHSDRVVAYSLRLGQALGLDAVEMRALEVGALLHDI